MMKPITNLAHAEQILSRFIPESSQQGNYTLETMQKLMEYLGNPQDNLKVIHIAGTSGKTSTAYFVAALLTAAGHRTGLTVSPHMTAINDRTQIDMVPLQEDQYCRELTEFLNLVGQSGLTPSHFEALVAFSYWMFDRHNVDYAVVEVGLGGLLDGTNVVTRTDKVCVITDIGFDHENILGNTLGKIAFQKAGIIHPNNHVFMHDQPAEVMDVVRSVVQTKHAQLQVISSDTVSDMTYLPMFQQRNFMLASRVVSFVLQRDGYEAVSRDQLTAASHTYIPGRMEVRQHHDKTIILDGAHNEQKIHALVDAIKQQFADQDLTLLVSFGQNKQASVQASLTLLRQLGSSIIITTFAKGQDEARSGMPLDQLAHYAKDAGFTSISVQQDLPDALQALYQSKSPVVLVVGSLYLIESVLPLVAEATN